MEKTEEEIERAEERLPEPLQNPSALLEDDESFSLTWATIVSGELLGGAWMRRQVKFIALVLGLTVLYVTNRYCAEQELIEIADSKKELQDIKYRCLTRGSELTMRSRQSMIEDALRSAGDTTLVAFNEPPFIISLSHAEQQ